MSPRSELDSTYPDNQVPMSYYTDSASNQKASNYFILSGTSMATPMVSGAAALLLDKEPNLTPDQVKARLMKTASKTFPTSSIATDPVTGEVFVSQYDIFTVGAGYLDVLAALSSDEVAGAEFNAASPTAVYDPETGQVYLIYSESALWGTSALWGVITIMRSGHTPRIIWEILLFVPIAKPKNRNHIMRAGASSLDFSLFLRKGNTNAYIVK